MRIQMTMPSVACALPGRWVEADWPAQFIVRRALGHVRRTLSLFSIQRDTCAAWLADLSIRLLTCNKSSRPVRRVCCGLRVMTASEKPVIAVDGLCRAGSDRRVGVDGR